MKVVQKNAENYIIAQEFFFSMHFALEVLTHFQNENGSSKILSHTERDGTRGWVIIGWEGTGAFERNIKHTSCQK